MKKRNDIFQGAALSKALMLAAFAAGMAGNCQAEEIQLRSKWDENLLNVELHDVSIDPNIMTQAWQQMGKKYLLRCNLYMDADSPADSAMFAFKKEKATGKELLEAFLAKYPAYTYTQSPEIGVIWIHRKSVAFNANSPRGSIP